MLFNSFAFLFFLPIVFIAYWFVVNKNLRLQNLFLLVASYVFYGWWDWRFLSLIFVSSLADYLIAQSIEAAAKAKQKRVLLGLSFLINLGILGFFKYFNFFIDGFASILTTVGVGVNYSTLKIILPVGISFYTFQTLSYTIDVYRNKLEPTKDIIAFFAFVSFFPQLVAGPIERASNLLPQFYKKRSFDRKLAEDGLRQMLWGFFKKIVIADNCAQIVNQIFDNYETYNGATLALGAVLFGLQIYGDFSGYSDIAIGTARLFGFNLMQNFAFPYFSRDIAEFWRRWHISLSSWFRDYVYIPLGGSRGSTLNQIRNVFVIFLVSGFWHGANYTFIAWGFLHAVFFIPLLLIKQNRKNIDIVGEGKIFPKPIELLQILLTFSLVTFAWIFFRAEDISHALSYIYHIAELGNTELKNISIWASPLFYNIVALVIIEWLHRTRQHGLDIVSIPQWFRWLIYLIIGFDIFLYGNFDKTEFIYFAF